MSRGADVTPLQLRSGKSRGQQLRYWGIKPSKPWESSLEMADHYVRFLPALGNTVEVMFHDSFVGVIPY